VPTTAVTGNSVMARRDEWVQQVKLAGLLDKWLDPSRSCWTATDPVAGSRTAGAMRKRCGVQFRERLLRANVEWWVCRTANAAMWALAESGVTFRTLVRNDGTTERWHRPKLADWEIPRRDPAERRPQAHGSRDAPRSRNGWRASARERRHNWPRTAASLPRPRPLFHPRHRSALRLEERGATRHRRGAERRTA
jgi:hypothetical protein